MTSPPCGAQPPLDRDILGRVHAFWFGELAPPTPMASREKSDLWFGAPPEFDDEIRAEFGSHLDAARETAAQPVGAYSPRQQIGLIVLLDQFPRNLFRHSRRQFAYDEAARAVARTLIADDRAKFYHDERKFLYLPFEHSEAPADQDLSVRLYAELACEAPPHALDSARDALDYAVRHRDVIRKFGRFPHRNALLGRESTPEEIAFLKGGRGF